MKRSAGVTITAVIDFAGCALTFLTALASIFVLLVGSIVLPRSPVAPPIEVSPVPRIFQVAAIFIFLLAVVWGVATAIGLLRLREWARISQLLFAGLTVLVGVSSAILVEVVSLFPNAMTAQQAQQLTRLVVALFYAGVAALGIWWLYYFTRRPIREQFSSAARQSLTIPAVISSTLPPADPRASVEPFVGPMHQGRPVSITVIAALMLLGVVNLIAVPIFRFPVLMFGRLISGAPGIAILLALAATQSLAGYGLLRMKMWGRNLAIAVELFGAANLLLTSLTPGSQARFDDFMQTIYAQWKLPANVPMIHFPVAAMMLPAIPVLIVILYFLIREKPAFIEAEHKAALKSS
jgi:hypothetical protein